MKWLARYLLALSPMVFFYGSWKLGMELFEHFHCKDTGKFIEPCFAYGVNIQGFLGFTMFWCQLLLYPATIGSIIWLLSLLINQTNKAGSNLPT